MFFEIRCSSPRSASCVFRHLSCSLPCQRVDDKRLLLQSDDVTLDQLRALACIAQLRGHIPFYIVEIRSMHPSAFSAFAIRLLDRVDDLPLVTTRIPVRVVRTNF